MRNKDLKIKKKVGLGIGVWGLGIGDWAQPPNPQSPIPNPQSPIPIKIVFYKIIIKINLHIIIK